MYKLRKKTSYSRNWLTRCYNKISVFSVWRLFLYASHWRWLRTFRIKKKKTTLQKKWFPNLDRFFGHVVGETSSPGEENWTRILSRAGGSVKADRKRAVSSNKAVVSHFIGTWLYSRYHGAYFVSCLHGFKCISNDWVDRKNRK